MGTLSRLKLRFGEGKEMNNKKLKVLSSALLAVTTVSAVSSASAETHWHVGVDVGLSQYKQERKQNKYPKYKDVNEMLDKEIKTVEDMRALMRELHQMVFEYGFDFQLGQEQNAIDNLQNANAIRNHLVQLLVNDAGYTQPQAQQEVNAIQGINAVNLPQIKAAAKRYLEQNKYQMDWAGANVNVNQFSLANVANFALENNAPLTNRLNTMMASKTAMANFMKKQKAKVTDLLSGDALKKYDKDVMNEMNALINTDLNTFLTGQNLSYIQFALDTNSVVQQWATANNWYGNNNHSASYQALVAKFNALKKAKDDYTKLLKDIKVKRQETEKVSSGRINSPVVEGNIGVTEQFDKGVLGADLIIGINCKEFGKKKKTDIYKQEKTPVYVAVIGRAGFMISDTVEPYVLAGLRLNNTAPIVGAGMRFYEKSKAYFFKAEFQKTLGKKYPKGHTIKLGFGWTL